MTDDTSNTMPTREQQVALMEGTQDRMKDRIAGIEVAESSGCVFHDLGVDPPPHLTQAERRRAWRRRSLRVLNIHPNTKARIDALKDRLGERDHSFPTIDEAVNWALEAANAKLDAGKGGAMASDPAPPQGTQAAPKQRRWPMSAQERHEAIIERMPCSQLCAEVEAASSEMVDHLYALDGDQPGSWKTMPEKSKNDMRALVSIGLHAAMAVWSKGEFESGRGPERTELERHLEATLREVKKAILGADPKILTDTLWVSDIETAVDCIDAALGEEPSDPR